MENTTENKLKMFAQYYGQKVVRFSVVDENSPNAENTFIDNTSLTHTILSDCAYLKLKSLTSITNEDALELVHSFGWKSLEDPIEAIAMVFTLFVMPSNDMVKYEMLVKQMLWDFSDISSAVDKIRSMGYAYKWMNVDVDQQVEYGWIKLID